MNVPDVCVVFWSILKDIRQYAIPVLQMLLLALLEGASSLISQGFLRHWRYWSHNFACSHGRGGGPHSGLCWTDGFETRKKRSEKRGSVGRPWNRNVSRVVCLFCKYWHYTIFESSLLSWTTPECHQFWVDTEVENASHRDGRDHFRKHLNHWIIPKLPFDPPCYVQEHLNRLSHEVLHQQARAMSSGAGRDVFVENTFGSGCDLFIQWYHVIPDGYGLCSLRTCT